MKIDLERNDLLRVMSRAQSIVERRTTIPILSNILIEAFDNKVSCRTTDLDIEIIDVLEASIEGSGAVTVHANTLYEIVRKLTEGSRLNLYHDQHKGRLELASGSSTFSLATLSKDDFPMMATSEYDCNFSMNVADATTWQPMETRSELGGPSGKLFRFVWCVLACGVYVRSDPVKI